MMDQPTGTDLAKLSTNELAGEANEWHGRVADALRTTIECAKSAGDALNEVFDRVPHGNWADWVKENFNGSSRTERVYRNISSEWSMLKVHFMNNSTLSIEDARGILSRAAADNDDDETSKPGYINRRRLLRQLEAVSPGLGTPLTFFGTDGCIPVCPIDQSGCFVITAGKVMTFNGKIACRCPCEIEDIDMAVVAMPLLRTLRQMSEKYITVEKCGDVLDVAGRNWNAGVYCDQEIVLPIGAVEEAGDWHPLHEDFTAAVARVQPVSAKDDDNYKLTCVHVTPTLVEACDNFRLMRYTLPTGLRSRFLIPQQAAEQIGKLNVTEVSEGEDWIHFRTPDNLVISIRAYTDAYENLEEILEDADGEWFTFPTALRRTVTNAKVLALRHLGEKLVVIKLNSGELRIRSGCETACYEERLAVDYDQKPLPAC